MVVAISSILSVMKKTPAASTNITRMDRNIFIFIVL